MTASNSLPPAPAQPWPLPWELASFACAPADASRTLTLAEDGGAAFTHAGFVHWVRQWQAPLKALEQQRIALFDSHPGRFAASLWAIWHANKTAILPGDTQPATLAALDQLGCARMGELPHAITLATPQPESHSTSISISAEQSPLQALDLQTAGIGLFTSGSQGQPQLIAKTLRQLDAEVRTLDASFGQALSQPPSTAPLQVWATVSHQHIYGLLFSVLWSMACGRPMGTVRLQYPEDIVRRISAPAVLISTPAHLKRLDAQLDWPAVQPHLQAVFSSGGPLPFEAAQTTAQLLQQWPYEIFGSSETGGIAWRQSTRANVPWQTFAPVQWRAEQGLLQVRSPHLADEHWYTTADRIHTLGEQHFELLGRSDRIAKIEEKRVSLTAIEQHLLQHPSVQEAKVLVLPSAIGDRTAAVVVLAAEALPRDAAQRHANARELRQWLRNSTEAVAIPRRWRFVPALPSNAQGKTPQGLLEQLFEPTHNAMPSEQIVPIAQAPKPQTAAPWPAGLVLQHGPTAAQLSCLEYSPAHVCVALPLAPELPVFQGHFPGSPILPGVAQLDWTLSLGLHAFALHGQFQGLQALKFVRPITPGTTLFIALDYRAKESEQVLHFRLYSHAENAAAEATEANADADTKTNADATVIEHASGRAIWSHALAATLPSQATP